MTLEVPQGNGVGDAGLLSTPLPCQGGVDPRWHEEVALVN